MSIASCRIHKKNLHKRFRFVFVAAAGMIFTVCTAIPVDYSEYNGVDLARTQFAASAAPGWVADEASGTNMLYQPDNIAGYGGTLQSDLDAATGITGLPIFRLETKNLFVNGDFEGLGGSIVGATTVQTLSSAIGLPASYFLNNKWLEINSPVSSTVSIALSTNISGYVVATPDNYTLSFLYCLDSLSPGFLTLDNALHNLGETSSGINQPTFITLYSSSNIIYRFPFTSPAGSGSSLLNPTATDRTTLFINNLDDNPPSPYTGKRQPFRGTFDDLQAVRSDLNNALRLDIPWTAAGRPNLQAGGHYTVKLWVRRDMTTHYVAGGTSNRFDADLVAISLHSGFGSSTDVGAVVVNSIGSGTDWQSAANSYGWINHTDIANWTEISASFAGPPTASAGLQLAISTTNMQSASLRSSGSILIADPRLFWSEN